ncbi:uncharacterized protein LOC114603114 [Podarcis muralis]
MGLLWTQVERGHGFNVFTFGSEKGQFVVMVPLFPLLSGRSPGSPVAIRHLGLLWGRAGQRWHPSLPEEAIAEVVNVLIHLEDTQEVAEAAKAALKLLVPKVIWWAEPNVFHLHHAPHKAAKYLIKTYSKDVIQGAALSLLQPAANKQVCVPSGSTA